MFMFTSIRYAMRRCMNTQAFLARLYLSIENQYLPSSIKDMSITPPGRLKIPPTPSTHVDFFTRKQINITCSGIAVGVWRTTGDIYVHRRMHKVQRNSSINEIWGILWHLVGKEIDLVIYVAAPYTGTLAENITCSRLSKLFFGF